MKEELINLRSLLERYIKHVKYHEGTDYLGKGCMEDTNQDFTIQEIEFLRYTSAINTKTNTKQESRLEALKQGLIKQESYLECCKWWETRKKNSIKIIIGDLNAMIVVEYCKPLERDERGIPICIDIDKEV